MVVLVHETHAPTKRILKGKMAKALNSGEVVAVGTGTHDKEGKLIPVSVKGDTVLLPEYGGTQVKLGDKEYGFSLLAAVAPHNFRTRS
ncbi:hypothetical protein I3842_13G114000 [Carya illinoinensis]|uniref:10 kDa chaperonin n=1 Tax=Carya illinoinensis TaxID=32201 RepID=A0A922AM21_CARIL|nr:hypothetical protein I3842_13G114000 [Carya illinoinensis]